MPKLNANQMHLLRLAQKGADPENDGWAPVSAVVWKGLREQIQSVPEELLEMRGGREGGGGFVRLTPQGETLVLWS